MCGIAGVLEVSPCGQRSYIALHALRDALRHRGPDDHGVFVSSEGHAALVHTRLSILDLTSAGHQPMHSTDGRYSITFNGEIYNFLELRSELERAGDVFRSNTDTEVLLRLYGRFGPACVGRLRGMFAFAIWDDLEKSCFIARDQFGIKPLYYHTDGARLVFASEIRPLLRAGLVPRRLNPAGVAGYFRNGSVPEPETLLQDVQCLPAAHAIVWRSGKIEEYDYGHLTFSRDSVPETDEMVTAVRAALCDSVEHHFVSDVPVGIFLSGGIDSTALLALAMAGGRSNVRTFCIRPAERQLDEGDAAKRTAAHFGAAHEDWHIDASTGRDLFDCFLGQLDQPTIDGYNTFVVSKFAHDQGMKVVLSGVGGDELFGGYPSFSRVPRLARMGERISTTGLAGRTVGATLERFAPKESWRRLGSFLQQPPSIVTAYEAYRGVFVPADADRLALGYTGSLGASHEPLCVWQAGAGDHVSALELTRYMRNQLLRDSDVMSMACGLELRTPFLDQPLAATLANIPASVRLQHGKKLLLDAVPEVPAWVAGQPKRTFAFPFRQWLDGDWQEMFRDASLKFGVHARTWYQQWAIVAFEHWCAEHGLN